MEEGHQAENAESLVCRLITVQRGVVRMARLLDSELGTGGEHEREYSSGEFLEKLYNIITEPDAFIHRVNAQSYVFASTQDLLELGARLYGLIDGEMIPQLKAVDDLVPVGHQQLSFRTAMDFKEAVDRQYASISVLQRALVRPDQHGFTEQVESGIIALSNLLTLAKSIQQQISTNKDKIETRRQNNRMIFWAIVSAVIGAGALLVGLAQLGSDTVEMILKALHIHR